MIKFNALIEQFGEQGEKTGWIYIKIPVELAQQLKPGNKKSFRVKGRLDNYQIKQVALMPMGGGDFIMALNAAMRKELKKGKGALLTASLAEDTSSLDISTDLTACLADEPIAKAYFNSLAPSHQKYFSKWIDDAKTNLTKEKRLLLAIKALSRKMDYGAMIREDKAKRNVD